MGCNHLSRHSIIINILGVIVNELVTWLPDTFSFPVIPGNQCPGLYYSRAYVDFHKNVNVMEYK